MTFNEYKLLVLSDLYRITGNFKTTPLIRHIIIGEDFQYVFWMRTCAYSKSTLLLRYLVYPFARLMLRHITYKLGISIPYSTKIGSGFCISHFGGIMVKV